jgi:hypothetical protein
MVDPAVDHVTSLATTTQLAGASPGLSIPIPAFSKAKAFIMMTSNLIIISGMSIQGKSLLYGDPKKSLKERHDEMVEEFGLTWLLSGASLGHIVGAGAILGCQAGGIV